MDERRFREKLSGRVRYPQDISSKNLIHIIPVYSQIDRGMLKGFILPELPKDTFFLTAKDIPGNNWLDFGLGGMPLFADTEINYKGQALAAICGPDREILELLHSNIKTQVEIRPALKDVDILDTDSICYEREVREGNTEEIFQRDDNIVLEDFFESEEQYHNSFPVPYSSCQKEGSRYVVHSICQWSWNVQKNISSLLKIKKESLQIRPYPCENSQDSKLFIPVQSAAISALACYHSKKTCTLMPTPYTGLSLSRGRGKMQIYLKAATNKQGDLLALKLDFSVDVGSYPIWAKEWVDRVIFSSTGSYHCRNIEIRGIAQLTSNPPVGQFPDGHLAPLFSAIELLMYQLSKVNGLSFYEWKIKNILRKGNGFYTGAILNKEINLQRMIDDVVNSSDFHRKYSSYQYQSIKDSHNHINNISRGIGISTAYMPAGFISRDAELPGTGVMVELNQEGLLRIDLPFFPGHKQLLKHWSLMAAEVLNLEEKKISFSYPPQPISGGPSTLGKNIMQVTSLINNCLVLIGKKRFRDPLPISVHKRVRKGTNKWDSELFQGLPYSSMTWGAMAVELKVEQETGFITISLVTLSLDAGVRLIPSLTDSIVERGIRQALSWLTMSTDPKTTKIPGFKERIPTKIIWNETGNQPKNLDGLVQSLFPAAYLMALSQATGITTCSIPPRLNSKELL